jgi:hypothetical protein
MNLAGFHPPQQVGFVIAHVLADFDIWQRIARNASPNRERSSRHTKKFGSFVRR